MMNISKSFNTQSPQFGRIFNKLKSKQVIESDVQVDKDVLALNQTRLANIEKLKLNIDYEKVQDYIDELNQDVLQHNRNKTRLGVLGTCFSALNTNVGLILTSYNPLLGAGYILLMGTVPASFGLAMFVKQERKVTEKILFDRVEEIISAENLRQDELEYVEDFLKEIQKGKD